MDTVKREAPLTLSELFDLEAQLQRDRSSTADELGERDLRYGARTGALPPGDGPAATLRRWLRWVYQGSVAPGRAYVRTYRILRSLLAVGGGLLGVSTMAPLLHYDGTLPINVSQVLGVLVGLQFLVLLALLYHLVRRKPPRRDAAGGAFRPTLVERCLTGIIFGRTPAADGAALRPDRLIEAGFATPLRSVLGPLLLGLTQTFAVAFNLGAVAYLLVVVSFTDLAFSWATTLTLEPATIQRLTDVLSWPWHWLGGTARPTLELVARTQYYRLGAAFGRHGGSAPDLAGSWWSFLLACIVTYGLMPRVVLLIYAAARRHRALARQRYDTPETEALLRRLGALSQAPGERPPAPAGTDAAVAAEHRTCGVVVWRDMPVDEAAVVAWVTERQRAKVAWVSRAGGLAGDLDAEACAGLVAAAAEPLVALVLADQFEDFDKALRRFVSGLRHRLGAAAPILILAARVEGGRLAPATEPARLAVWSAGVKAARDRYLGFGA